MASNSTSTPKDPTTTTTPPPPPPTTATTSRPSSLPPPALRPISQPRSQFHHHPFHPRPQQQPPPQQPHHHIQPSHFQTQTQTEAQTQTQTHLHPHDSIRYPLASSGRGLLPTPRSLIHHHPHPHPQLSEQLHNPSVHFQHHHQQQQQHHSNHNHHVVRGTFLHPSSTNNTTHLSPVSIPGVPTVRGVLPQSKVGPSPYSAPESIAPKDPIDKGTDDTVVTLRDRKVRISDGASLYALCRSWLRNGYLEETQPQYGDVLKSLSKPLPLPLPPHESPPPKRKERDDETEADEVENLAEADAKELLSSHVKRAKKIRAGLREERLQRIERYKSRLVLLLPHSVPE